MAQVVSVVKSQDNLNPAAMAETIEGLVVSKYTGPDWVRQGVNFIMNKVTGETVNLNQEATAALQDAPPRSDALAVVQNDAGGHDLIWVPQSAVTAVNGDLAALKNNLNATLVTPMNPMVKYALMAGAAFVIYKVIKG